MAKHRNKNQANSKGKSVDDPRSGSTVPPSRPKSNGFKPRVKFDEPKKDSNSKRINLDNARISKVEKDIEKGSKSLGKNDISFWNRNPELLKSAGSLPFATIAGRKLQPGLPFTKTATVPGIMVFEYVPTIGADEIPIEVNKAAQNVFSFLVHANSRNYSYNAPDLFILMQAGSEVFGAIANAIRAYGLIKYSIEENDYTPNGLIYALGFSAMDLRENLSNMWFDINAMIIATEKIWVPKDFTYLKRQFDLNSLVYKDSEGSRAQYYAFKRKVWYEYDEKSITTGCALKAAHSIDGTISWNAYKKKVWSMIDALNNSEDRGVIYGDLLNAYGANNIFSMAPIDAGYRVEPVYNAEVLTQVENLTVCDIIPEYFAQWQGTSVSDDISPQVVPIWEQFDIQDSVDSLAFYLTKFPPASSILNFHFSGQPTPEAIMTATRFKCGTLRKRKCFKLEEAPSSTTGMIVKKTENYIPTTCGTEIVTQIRIFEDITSSDTIKAFTNYTSNSEVLVPEVRPNIKTFSRFMAFDWHPFLYDNTYTNTATGWIVEWQAISGDFDNYIVVSPTELKKLHDTALYSMYNAKFTG